MANYNWGAAESDSSVCLITSFRIMPWEIIFAIRLFGIGIQETTIVQHILMNRKPTNETIRKLGVLHLVQNNWTLNLWKVLWDLNYKINCNKWLHCVNHWAFQREHQKKNVAKVPSMLAQFFFYDQTGAKVGKLYWYIFYILFPNSKVGSAVFSDILRHAAAAATVTAEETKQYFMTQRAFGMRKKWAPCTDEI